MILSYLNKLSLLLVLTLASCLLFAQSDPAIDVNETARIIRILASDSLEGRGNGEPGILKAAHFIGEEFRKNKLKPLPGFPNYFLEINPTGKVGGKTAYQLKWNGATADHFFFIPFEPGQAYPKSLKDFKVIKIDSFFTEDVLKNYSSDSALVLWSDKRQPGGSDIFPSVFKPPAEGLHQNRLLVFADKAPDSIELSVSPGVTWPDYNVVGILPGKSKPAEVILFSAHYDHLGVEGTKRRRRIMNGANDNASGTTAVLQLASYFAKQNDNERTLVFCAFAEEEMGLIGSKDFRRILNPSTIIADINIEMIGIPQYGRKTVFFTGDFNTPLSRILQKNTPSADLKFTYDRNPEKYLFQRSDNFSFAEEGVPTVGIMASDDDDYCYHKDCDEIDRIKIPNMNDIINGIAKSVRTLVDGSATPPRVNKGDIKEDY